MTAWEEGRHFLNPCYHFHPLHRHLDNSGAIIVDSSPLHIVSHWTRTGNLWFPSTLLATKLCTLKKLIIEGWGEPAIKGLGLNSLKTRKVVEGKIVMKIIFSENIEWSSKKMGYSRKNPNRGVGRWQNGISRSSHKNKLRFNQDKPSKLISKLVRFNWV